MATKVPIVTKGQMATNRTKCNPHGLASYEIWVCLSMYVSDKYVKFRYSEATRFWKNSPFFDVDK